MVLLCLVLPLDILARDFSENQIKGAFLYKITKFIRWESPESKIKLCFIGDKEDQFGETIGNTVSLMASKDPGKFDISKNVNINDIINCNMLFIGVNSEPNLQDILAVLNNKSIVTISDISSFTRRGGMFGFYKQNGNVSVELNYLQAQVNDININSAIPIRNKRDFEDGFSFNYLTYYCSFF